VSCSAAPAVTNERDSTARIDNIFFIGLQVVRADEAAWM
jgi:hypothetical protein